MGSLFLLEGNVATSVAILIWRESVFPSHSRKVPDSLIDLAWIKCTSLNLTGHVWVIGAATTNICVGVHCKEDKQEPKPSAGHTYQTFTWCMTMSAREAVPFCNSLRHWSDLGHMLTSEQRLVGVIPTWTRWFEDGERTVGAQKKRLWAGKNHNFETMTKLGSLFLEGYIVHYF